MNKMSNKNGLNGNLGHLKVTKYLVENGANVNNANGYCDWCDDEGVSPLHLSVDKGIWKILVICL